MAKRRSPVAGAATYAKARMGAAGGESVFLAIKAAWLAGHAAALDDIAKAFERVKP